MEVCVTPPPSLPYLSAATRRMPPPPNSCLPPGHSCLQRSPFARSPQPPAPVDPGPCTPHPAPPCAHTTLEPPLSSTRFTVGGLDTLLSKKGRERGAVGSYGAVITREGCVARPRPGSRRSSSWPTSIQRHKHLAVCRGVGAHGHRGTAGRGVIGRLSSRHQQQ